MPTLQFIEEIERVSGTPVSLISTSFKWRNVIDRRALASSLKFGLIAKGEADVYPRVGPTCEWDTAAGHAVLAAAGGTVTTIDGAPLLYGHAERGFENPDFVAWGRGPLARVREV